MKKILKTTCQEMSTDGRFLRYNINPIDMPDDVVVRWVGDNEEFGIIEVYSENDKGLEEFVGNTPNVEEIESDITGLPTLDKEEPENLQYGYDISKSLITKSINVDIQKAELLALESK